MTAAQLATLEAAVARHNGTRRARILDVTQVLDAIALALVDPHGLGLVHGGETTVPADRTTLCLAVRDGAQLTIGIATSRARGPTPATAWPALQPWNHDQLEKNRDRLRAWARDPARVTFAIDPARARVPAPPADLSALLGAVLADPDDDAPREVYADRLIELGDPRGEFITIQLALARTSDFAELLEREARANTLLAAHGAHWHRDLAQVSLRQQYRRGFVEAVDVRARTFVEHGERLLELAPIRRVRLHEVEPATLRKLARCPALGRVRELGFASRLPDRNALRLAAGGQLRGLRALDLAGTAIQARGLSALLDATPALERVTLASIADPLAEALARYPGLQIISQTSRLFPGAPYLALERTGRLEIRPTIVRS
ncbi:MAG TPA: TIGR02996 domain-containing protein [Kofleriaceae bacterium]|nr:TIGR02996 domain-containing protein [Kofleriaceae bacterium]